jgi:hypothetical protein
MIHKSLELDLALAQRIIGVVPYKDRLPAGRLRPPVGMLRGDVRSLQEVYLLLTPDEQSLPGINLNALAEWIEHVIGDAHLAEEVRKATLSSGSYVESCIEVHALVGKRLERARTILVV